MGWKMTMWLLALMFVAMVYNGVSAYTAMGSSDVQGRFQQIGLIAEERHFIMPAHKPLSPKDMLASIE